MTAQPQVDIVVATNRASPYLEAAVRSVAEQTYPHWSLIVVDDGVADPAFVPHAVRHITGARVIRHINRGLGASRNAGMAAGSSPLIAFLDDDDVWAPSKLDAQVDSLAAAADALGSFTGGWYMDHHGVSQGWGWTAATRSSTDFLRGAEPLPRIVTLMIRRTALDEIDGFLPSLTMAEDLEFTLRLLQAGPLACAPGQLTGYRRHANNMTAIDLVALRRAAEHALALVLVAAEQRGDATVLALLRENLRRSRAQWSKECARSVGAALRHLDLRTLALELRWAATTAPGSTTAAALQKAGAKLLAPRPADR
ncbi:glycosyltransferase family 2 protein [Rhodococcus antarcticus]|uniref:Glycosyltransferase family 2 protein n=1 Tax=Rhodococcus antarcticus TaxID=2987751 RepID=A0ABY6P001_9NOCA|nr:glycosyltransferase family A protein [Rhodococcus antarcticus]UZJ24960.1 glycosyltransferase family 2 protein [Rhodococcus antarcticus]